MQAEKSLKYSRQDVAGVCGAKNTSLFSENQEILIAIRTNKPYFKNVRPTHIRHECTQYNYYPYVTRAKTPHQDAHSWGPIVRSHENGQIL